MAVDNVASDVTCGPVLTAPLAVLLGAALFVTLYSERTMSLWWCCVGVHFVLVLSSACAARAAHKSHPFLVAFQLMFQPGACVHIACEYHGAVLALCVSAVLWLSVS